MEAAENGPLRKRPEVGPGDLGLGSGIEQAGFRISSRKKKKKKTKTRRTASKDPRMAKEWQQKTPVKEK